MKRKKSTQLKNTPPARNLSTFIASLIIAIISGIFTAAGGVMIAGAQARTDTLTAKKIEAYMEAFSLIDAHLAHSFELSEEKVSAQQTRQAHTKLIIYAEDPRTADLYMQIVAGEDAKKIALLQTFRDLAKKDIGISTKNLYDPEKLWIAISVSDVKKEHQ